jgi:LPS export ABC transporter protein LptC
MVLRIEYILILVLIVLALSIVGINPASQSAIKSTVDKEILFQNFSLSEFKENALSENILASEAIKYKTHFDLKNINLKDENGHTLLADEVIYRDNSVYMDKNIVLTSKEGLVFTTENIYYTLKDKLLKSTTPFVLDFNGSKIKGEHLEYSMKSKDVSADNIHASILFVSTSK